MAQDSLQCLAQLASMQGPVFPDESAQVSYLAHLVEGLLSMINGSVLYSFIWSLTKRVLMLTTSFFFLKCCFPGTQRIHDLSQMSNWRIIHPFLTECRDTKVTINESDGMDIKSILWIFIVCMSVMPRVWFLSSSSVYRNWREIKKMDDVNVRSSTSSQLFSFWCKGLLTLRYWSSYCRSTGWMASSTASEVSTQQSTPKMVFHLYILCWGSLFPLGSHSNGPEFFNTFLCFYRFLYCEFPQNCWSRFQQALETNRWS